MWSSHHQFQMIFLSQSRLFPCIIAFTMILYQMTLNLAWYINSYITFQIGTCPRPPRFDNHDEAWLCLGLAAFITLSFDNIAIMRALDMQWCTYRGSHHHHIPMYIPTYLFPLLSPFLDWCLWSRPSWTTRTSTLSGAFYEDRNLTWASSRCAPFLQHDDTLYIIEVHENTSIFSEILSVLSCKYTQNS